MSDVPERAHSQSAGEEKPAEDGNRRDAQRHDLPSSGNGEQGSGAVKSAGNETGSAATVEVGAIEASCAEKLSREKLEGLVVDALRSVYDPEIPVNIYDLGLIYDLQVDDEGRVEVKMTLTTPACPIAEAMPGMVEHAVRFVHGVTDCDIELVWDPPWTPDMMTEAARLQLNI